jgi:hypothetical protein
MKTLQVDLNLLTDMELEAYLVVKKATERLQKTKDMKTLEKNVNTASRLGGWSKGNLPEMPPPPNPDYNQK